MNTSDNFKQFQRFCENAENRAALKKLSPLIQPHAAEVARRFYDAMMAEPVAAPFLDHELVQSRLTGTMTAWIEHVFGEVQEGCDLPALIARQHEIGGVHARISIPMPLLNQGGRILKRELFQIVVGSHLPREELYPVIAALHDLLDLLVGAINEAYMDNMVVNERNAVSMQMNSVNHDLALECQRLRASLYDWLSRFLLMVYERHEIAASAVEEFHHSELALWLRNKADFMLPSTREIAQLHEEVDQVETLLDTAKEEGRLRAIITTLQQHVANISYLLTSLVEHTLKVETGRDPLTRLMTRRFLPTVMQRMCMLGIQHRFPFSVLLIDIDHFKSINDRLGHAAGDAALERIAETMLTSIRASDFIFRYGGEEFLIVLGDAAEEEAAKVADSLLQKVAHQDIQVTDHETIHLTISIGVAAHDGHPDYAQLLSRADTALYQAKEQGRNCVVVAPP